jgi:hypothetical protein
LPVVGQGRLGALPGCAAPAPAPAGLFAPAILMPEASSFVPTNLAAPAGPFAPANLAAAAGPLGPGKLAPAGPFAPANLAAAAGPFAPGNLAAAGGMWAGSQRPAVALVPPFSPQAVGAGVQWGHGAPAALPGALQQQPQQGPAGVSELINSLVSALGGLPDNTSMSQPGAAVAPQGLRIPQQQQQPTRDAAGVPEDLAAVVAVLAADSGGSGRSVNVSAATLQSTAQQPQQQQQQHGAGLPQSLAAVLAGLAAHTPDQQGYPGWARATLPQVASPTVQQQQQQPGVPSISEQLAAAVRASLAESAGRMTLRPDDSRAPEPQPLQAQAQQQQQQDTMGGLDHSWAAATAAATAAAGGGGAAQGLLTSPPWLPHGAPVEQQQQPQQGSALLQETLAAALRASLAGSSAAAVAPAQGMDLDVSAVPPGGGTGPADAAQVPIVQQDTAATGSTLTDILVALQAQIGNLAPAGAAYGQFPAAPTGTVSTQGGQIGAQVGQGGVNGGRQSGRDVAQSGVSGAHDGPVHSGPAGVTPSAHALAEILSILASVPHSGNEGREQTRGC